MLSLAGKKIKGLSEETIEGQDKIEHLDLSQNQLKSGAELNKFKNLRTLIIDNNFFVNLQDFPMLPELNTLSANKNNFKDLDEFLVECCVKFPKLTNLSLLKNPLCPFFVSEEEYYKYRMKIIKKLPLLKTLDGMDIDLTESFKTSVKDQPDQQLQKDEEKKVELEGDAKGTIEYNKKYSKVKPASIKSRSEGNRFVKNDQL